MFSHEGPVLSVCWSKDGTKVISGGADKAARMFDVQTGQTTQVAAHDAPIKSVKWIDAQNGILATGSWDKTLKVGTYSILSFSSYASHSSLVLGSPNTESCDY